MKVEHKLSLGREDLYLFMTTKEHIDLPPLGELDINLVIEKDVNDSHILIAWDTEIQP